MAINFEKWIKRYEPRPYSGEPLTMGEIVSAKQGFTDGLLSGYKAGSDVNWHDYEKERPAAEFECLIEVEHEVVNGITVRVKTVLSSVEVLPEFFDFNTDEKIIRWMKIPDAL